jgi:putative ABC transport system permease protein
MGLFPLREGARMAVFSLWSNRLRTFLSLLGISIGIFTVITVFTLVDSWELQIRSSLANLGNDVVYVEKWPWGFNSEYPWWKYMARPQPSYREFGELQRRSRNRAKIAMMVDFEMDQLTVPGRERQQVKAYAVSHDYPVLRSFELEQGRFFQPGESASGARCVVLGAKVAEDLFGSAELAIGRNLRAMGQQALVVGIVRLEGNNSANTSLDDVVLLPLQWLRKTKGSRFEEFYPLLMAKPGPGVPFSEFKGELRGNMRAIRRLAPRKEDNFAFNQLSLIATQLQSTFATLGIIGWLVGGFSLLVGGFGIANIMFVSVYERTPQIGIQMALGARRSFVILQFLIESVVLSLMGGILGLVGVGITVLALNATLDQELVLLWKNVTTACVISALIGLIAGVLPAVRAGRMDPVEAIRQS